MVRAIDRNVGGVLVHYWRQELLQASGLRSEGGKG